MSDGVKPTETDMMIVRQGMMIQLDAHGLKDQFETDEHFKNFVEHQIKVRATDGAYIRMQSNALQKTKE